MAILRVLCSGCFLKRDDFATRPISGAAQGRVLLSTDGAKTSPQANKLSRTYSVLLDALNRWRGKAQQTVTMEHVHVHFGGQAVVRMLEPADGRSQLKAEEQHHARQIAHNTSAEDAEPEREAGPVQVTSYAERPMPDARRKSTGAPMGNRNALKHGRYTAEAVARCCEFSQPFRSMKLLAKEVSE
jgi:hypothetical protein